MHDVVPAEKSFTEVTSPLGSRAAMRVGSSPFRRTKKKDMTKGHVFLFGTPEGTRTPNIQNRNLTLYPIELRALINRSVIIAGLP